MLNRFGTCMPVVPNIVVVNVARRDLGSHDRSPVLCFCGVRRTRC